MRAVNYEKVLITRCAGNFAGFACLSFMVCLLYLCRSEGRTVCVQLITRCRLAMILGYLFVLLASPESVCLGLYCRWGGRKVCVQPSARGCRFPPWTACGCIASYAPKWRVGATT